MATLFFPSISLFFYIHSVNKKGLAQEITKNIIIPVMNRDKNKNTTSDKKIKTLIENQKAAQSWLGKWYWQIRIDREKNKNRARGI